MTTNNNYQKNLQLTIQSLIDTHCSTQFEEDTRSAIQQSLITAASVEQKAKVQEWASTSETDFDWKIDFKLISSEVALYEVNRDEIQLHIISKEQEEFRKAASQFAFFTDQPINMVTKVEVIVYSPESNVIKNFRNCKDKFIKSHKPISEIQVFHGTNEETNVQGIIAEGFKVGGVDPGIPIKNGMAYGTGVYTSLASKTAQTYARVSKYM